MHWKNGSRKYLIFVGDLCVDVCHLDTDLRTDTSIYLRVMSFDE